MLHIEYFPYTKDDEKLTILKIKKDDKIVAYPKWVVYVYYGKPDTHTQFSGHLRLHCRVGGSHGSVVPKFLPSPQRATYIIHPISIATFDGKPTARRYISVSEIKKGKKTSQRFLWEDGRITRSRRPGPVIIFR